MLSLTIDINYLDAFNEAEHPRGEGGQFSAAGVAKSINAPSHANVHEGGGEHGGGSVGFAARHDHSVAHKSMSQGGFKRVAAKARQVSTKMGRSTAYSSSKEQKSEYEHPHGHTATVKTSTPKYGDKEPVSFYNIHVKKPNG